MSNTKRTGQTALYERLSRDDEMQGEAESVRSCIEKLQQENREITQAKKQELDL